MVCKIKNTLFEDIKKVTIYGKTVFPSGLLAEFFIAMFVRKWMSILQMCRTQMELYTFLQSPLCWPFSEVAQSQKSDISLFTIFDCSDHLMDFILELSFSLSCGMTQSCIQWKFKCTINEVSKHILLL